MFGGPGVPGTLRNAAKNVAKINFRGPKGVQERPGMGKTYIYIYIYILKFHSQAGLGMSRSAQEWVKKPY